MFTVPGRPAITAAKKRKNERLSPVTTKRSKHQHQDFSGSQLRIPTTAISTGTISTIQTAAQAAAKHAV